MTLIEMSNKPIRDSRKRQELSRLELPDSLENPKCHESIVKYYTADPQSRALSKRRTLDVVAANNPDVK